MSNLQLNKLNCAAKNETEVFLRLSSNMIGNSDDETNFPHELLLTNRQVANLLKVFANDLPVYMKLSKTQLSKMIQPGESLGRLLGLLIKARLALIKNVTKPLVKTILIPLVLTTADVGIHKKSLSIWNNNIKNI